jgi:hypothetical protein
VGLIESASMLRGWVSSIPSNALRSCSAFPARANALAIIRTSSIPISSLSSFKIRVDGPATLWGHREWPGSICLLHVLTAIGMPELVLAINPCETLGYKRVAMRTVLARNERRRGVGRNLDRGTKSVDTYWLKRVGEGTSRLMAREVWEYPTRGGWYQGGLSTTDDQASNNILQLGQRGVDEVIAEQDRARRKGSCAS